MIIGVAAQVQQARSVPAWLAPLAIIRVHLGGGAGEREPSALHFRHAMAAIRALLRSVARKIHVLRRIALLVINAQRPAAAWKGPRGPRVGAASLPHALVGRDRRVASG